MSGGSSQSVGWVRRRLFLLAGLTLTGALPAHAASDRPPNVIFITIDTLRADHLGCYGDERAETPNIDRLARAGMRFTRAYTPVPITLPAHTAIFTGSFPMTTGMHDFSGNKLPSSAVTLARLLREHGYTTAAFVGAAVLDSRFGLNQGFETYFDHFDINPLEDLDLDRVERRGDQVMDEALAWLKLHPRQPVFLWVHLYDPHAPYTPPEPFASRYRSRPYDGEIAFDDAQVGRLASFLRDQNLFDSALVVLAGDHGEGLGEHGEKTHGFFIYNSTLHVPLIIRLPAGFPGAAPRTVEDEVSLVDVMPTLLQALEVPIPATVQGRSLLGRMLARSGSAAATELYAETYLPLLHFHWSQLRGLEWRGWKYIDAPRPELYDTRSDPREQKNLAGARQALADEMHDRLYGLVRRLTPSAGNAEKEATDPALLERLRSLGYVAVSAGSVSDASGKPLPDPKDRIGVYEQVSVAMADGQHGRYEQSIAELEQAEKGEPNSVAIRYLKALDYYRMKDFRRAHESFKTVLELDPKFALATYYLGLTELELSDQDAAQAAFQRALELDPTNFSAAYNLGVLSLKRRHLDEALGLFERAVRINPEYAQAYEAQGELYLYQGRTDEAVQALERAVGLRPGFAKAHYSLGRAYQAQGRTADAEREFAHAGAKPK